MAYPVVTTPYGFKPINLIGGQVFAGSTRQIPIASGYGTALNNGDLIKLSNGTCVINTLTYNSTSAVAGTIGVFLGCSYTSPTTGQKVFSNGYPASTTANDIVAYVEDDPDAVFQAVILPYNTGGSLVAQPVSQSYVGTNVFVNSQAPAASSIVPAQGVSAMGVQLASGNDRLTTTAPFRIVGLVPDTATTVTAIATTTSASATLTLAAANSLITVGMQVIGAGVAQGLYIYVSAVSGTSVTLSSSTGVTASTSTQFTFVGSPEVKVKWNFGYHSYYAAAGV
jgi:hypothetical protein